MSDGHYDPDIQSDGHPLVSDCLCESDGHIVSDGHEPSVCVQDGVGHTTWVEGHVANLVHVAKHRRVFRGYRDTTPPAQLPELSTLMSELALSHCPSGNSSKENDTPFWCQALADLSETDITVTSTPTAQGGIHLRTRTPRVPRPTPIARYVSMHAPSAGQHGSPGNPGDTNDVVDLESDRDSDTSTDLEPESEPDDDAPLPTFVGNPPETDGSETHGEESVHSDGDEPVLVHQILDPSSTSEHESDLDQGVASPDLLRETPAEENDPTSSHSQRWFWNSLEDATISDYVLATAYDAILTHQRHLEQGSPRHLVEYSHGRVVQILQDPEYVEMLHRYGEPNARVRTILVGLPDIHIWGLVRRQITNFVTHEIRDSQANITAMGALLSDGLAAAPPYTNLWTAAETVYNAWIAILRYVGPPTRASVRVATLEFERHERLSNAQREVDFTLHSARLASQLGDTAAGRVWAIEYEEARQRLNEARTPPPPSTPTPPDGHSTFATTIGPAPPTGGFEMEWIVDTGCTVHVCNDISAFETLEPCSTSLNGTGGDLLATGRGTIRVPVLDTEHRNQWIYLDNVLFAPTLHVNLLSLQNICINGAHSALANDVCTLTDPVRGFSIDVPLQQSSRLYVLRTQPRQHYHACLALRPDTPGQDNLLKWHRRMGHPGETAMRTFFRLYGPALRFNISTRAIRNFFCDSCVLAKSCLLPVSKVARHLATHAGHTFHSDICGPFSIPTYSGYVYFVVFVDEFTRYCFVYLMHLRSDLYKIYTQFVADMRQHHNRRIEMLCHTMAVYDTEPTRLQMDNAGEYQKLGRIILEKYGTKSTFAQAYTPSENGIAERRMRTSLEKTRSLLIDGDLPAPLWGEALLASSLLMNVTPSTAIDWQIPFREWHGYSFPIQKLHVFGCVAFAHIPRRHQPTKLHPRAVKCMFVGYPTDHTGYRLLNVATRLTVISKDVVFHETRFAKLNTEQLTDDQAAAECGCRQCIASLSLLPPTLPPQPIIPTPENLPIVVNTVDCRQNMPPMSILVSELDQPSLGVATLDGGCSTGQGESEVASAPTSQGLQVGSVPWSQHVPLPNPVAPYREARGVGNNCAREIGSPSSENNESTGDSVRPVSVNRRTRDQDLQNFPSHPVVVTSPGTAPPGQTAPRGAPSVHTVLGDTQSPDASQSELDSSHLEATLTNTKDPSGCGLLEPGLNTSLPPSRGIPTLATQGVSSSDSSHVRREAEPAIFSESSQEFAPTTRVALDSGLSPGRRFGQNTTRSPLHREVRAPIPATVPALTHDHGRREAGSSKRTASHALVPLTRDMEGVQHPYSVLDAEMEGQEFMFHVSHQHTTPFFGYVRPLDRGIHNMALHLERTNAVYDNTASLSGRIAKRARRALKVSLKHSAPSVSVQYDLDEDVELDDKLYKGYVFHAIVKRHIATPQTYREVLKSPDVSDWLTAMDSEHNSLIANETWELVKRPPRRKILDSRWVYAVKYTETGEIDRFKARLVVKGYLQKYGIDYVETFAPVVRMEVLRMILTIAASLDWEIHQMDVKTAFLNGFLEEEIYMNQPEGYVTKGKENLVCRLLKSLYGLKQAPRVWHGALTEYLLSCGFKPLVIDRCVFINTDADGNTCIISAYVDDLLIVANTLAVMHHVKAQLSGRFKMTDLGEIHFLLGWHIRRNRTQRMIFITQEKYAEKVLERFKFDAARPSKTPMEANTSLRHADRPELPSEIAAMANIPYREVIGSLMYLMVGTRPDLATLIRETSQHLTNPGKVHWEALTRALRYLRGTSSYGIRLGGVHAAQQLRSGSFLSAYCDADFANAESRRSVTGYVTLLVGNSPISWRSQMQSLVTLSSTEAEYVALAACVQEVKYLRTLLRELGFEHTAPVTVYEDNQSCIKLVKNPESHGRTKHIDIKYHFLQEAYAALVIFMVYCATSEMIADTLTKSLPAPAYKRHNYGMGVFSLQEIFPHLGTNTPNSV